MSTLSPTDFFKAAQQTAHHFGFLPVDTLERPARNTKQVPAPKPSVAERNLDDLEGNLIQGISTYFEQSLHNEKPQLFFSTHQIPRTQEAALTLQVVGVKKSIAESLLIQTLRSLIRDLGYQHHSVRVNSLGDHDSVTRYTRELATYLKKRLEQMPPEARELMKDDVIAAFLYLTEMNHELCAKSPSPLEYLSDASRRHFREIIEHFDMTETSYEIDPRLIGHHHCYTDTIFSLELTDEHGVTLPDMPFTIRGGRLDAFVKHVFKTETSATSAVIILNNKKAPARIARPRKQPSAPIFMIQLGFGPKIKSLMLLDTLKTAGISVQQALISDSLSEQLRQAESYNVPFSLILGQKEFVENSIIVRDMRSRSQQNIPFDGLVPHLKRLLKKI